ncbi:MAG: ABC transporter ATP-binding protein [Clostridia bacterium]|nr:ABC transporter ATP-binding protein [Clostridia bacterium]
MEKVLEVKGLTKIFKNGRGIKDLSFDIYKGEIFGLLGPNGAGKTTAMKIISGLMKPNKGEIKVFDKDLFTNFEQCMQKMGFIIETVEAHQFMSAYKNLRLASRFYENITDSRIEEVLELVGLTSYKKEKVANFSLGMKQRLGLAMAMLSRPDLLILDEPSNGLDIEGIIEIREAILKLAQNQHTSFIISSHLAHEIEVTATRIGIIIDGQLIATGNMKEITKEGQTLEDFYIKHQKNKKGA